MKKKLVGICFQNHSNHYFIPLFSVGTGNDGSMYLFFHNDKSGAHISFHPKEFHFKNNEETIVIPKEKVTDDIRNSLNEIKKIKEIPYTKRPLIIDVIEMAFKIVKLNGCDNKKCPNEVGLSIDLNMIRYDLVEFLNSNKDRIKKAFGPPKEGLYEEKNDMEEDEGDYSSFMNEFDDRIGEIHGEPCKFCKNLPFIFFKKGKYHFFECPKCNGLKINPKSIERYRIK